MYLVRDSFQFNLLSKMMQSNEMELDSCLELLQMSQTLWSVTKTKNYLYMRSIRLEGLVLLSIEHVSSLDFATFMDSFSSIKS